MIRIFWFIILMGLLSCDKSKESKDNRRKATDGVNRSYYKDGKVMAEINMKSGKRHGIAKNFYPNGIVSLEMTYEEGIKQGVAKRYYENGQLYEEYNYSNNELDGVKKRYREDGAIMAEAIFKNGNPCLGLKEFHLTGELKKNYPELIIKEVDQISDRGRYTLTLSLSERVRKVKYYTSNRPLKDCISDELTFVLLDESKGKGIIEYTVPPGGYLMQELNVIAVFETSMGNTQIIQKKHFISITN